MAKKKKRGRKRMHSMHKAGFAGPIRKRGRKKKASKKFSAKQLAHHARMKSNPIRGNSVAKHMAASLKRGLHRAEKQLESVADHMKHMMKMGHR